jgi:hypothetical protein
LKAANEQCWAHAKLTREFSIRKSRNGLKASRATTDRAVRMPTARALPIRIEIPAIGHYRRKLDGQSIDFPDEAAITGPYEIGRTMVRPI